MKGSTTADSMDTGIDPITLALTQSRLDDICRQMGWVMTRTARSPIFSDSHDFSCFITDREGTLVSQADGIPIHTGGGGWGDPDHRDPMRVLRDARDGILSKEAAESVYAVAISADGRSIDAEATGRLRESNNSTDP